MKKVIVLYKPDGCYNIDSKNPTKQIKYCRFIIFREAKRIHARFFNSYDRRTSYKSKEGLQIGNIFYYVEYGVIKHSRINKQCASIRKVFKGIPYWANPLLVKKYYDFQSKKLKTG